MSDDANNVENRRFKRVAVESSLLYKDVERPNDKIMARTANLSLGGMMFLTDSLPGVGACVDMLFPFRGTVVSARAKVVWEVADKLADAVRVGVEFMSVGERERALIAQAVAG